MNAIMCKIIATIFGSAIVGTLIGFQFSEMYDNGILIAAFGVPSMLFGFLFAAMRWIPDDD